MGNTTIAENDEDASFIWDNYFDEETGRNEYDLTLFIRQENGLYERVSEVHEEQGYTPEQIREYITRSGMEYVRTFDAESGEVPEPASEKVFYVVREHGKALHPEPDQQ